MLKRLIGMTKKKPLHLRHEPSFVEQQHPLAPRAGTEVPETEVPETEAPETDGARVDRYRSRHHPAARVPTLSIEQAKHLQANGSDYADNDSRQRITTTDALDQIRRKESNRHSELGIY